MLSSDTYALCCTTNSPVEFINEFLERHLSLGNPPSEVFLFLDEPDNIAKEQLVQDSRIRLFECDEQFWSSQPATSQLLRLFPNFNGKRPKAVEIRQHYNFVLAYDLAQSEWIASVDTDEIFYSKRPIGSVLAEYPANVHSVLAMPLEAAYLDRVPRNAREVFSTNYFHARMHRVGREFWDNYFSNPNLSSNGGYWGHTTGKTLVRTGFDFRTLSVHVCQPLNSTLFVAEPSSEIFLLHFEALTPELFRTKAVARTTGRYYAAFQGKKGKDNRAYIADVYSAEGDEGIERLYRQMHVLDSQALPQLLATRMIVDTREEFERGCARVFTSDGLSLVADSNGTVVPVSPGDLNSMDPGASFVYTIFSDRAGNLHKYAYFYAFVDGERRPILVNPAGGLTVSSYSGGYAQLFELVRGDGTTFSLMFDGVYLSASRAFPSKSGEVRFRSASIGKTETFKYQWTKDRL